jgi:hypothetical protein
MTKSEIKNIISKYTERIEIEFYFNYEEDGEPASLNISAWYDENSIILETIISGTNEELKCYTEYEGLKKSFITKYNKWVKWFRENYSKSEIKENRIVCHT